MGNVVSLTLLGCRGVQNELQELEHTFQKGEKTGVKESVI